MTVFVNSENNDKSKHKIPTIISAIISGDTLRDDHVFTGFIEQAEVKISV